MKKNQAEALMVLCKPGKIEARINETGLMVLKNKRTHSVEFEHRDLNKIIGFLWGKSRNRQITIFESPTHRVVIGAYKTDGFAKFTMEMHIKSEPNVYQVENLVSTSTNKAQKTQLTRLPRSVEEVLNLSWFKELRSMLRIFNENDYYATI